MSPRRRFKEWEVIATLIHQGIVVTCFRTKQPFTLETVKTAQREHLIDRAVDDRPEYDTPEYCRYSLKQAHAVVTNGTKATTAGSSKHIAGKMKRFDRVNAGERSRKRKGPPLKS